ncbi:MAG: hypothetical protein R2699_06115 [Acidimicrobiales bacterium]
MVALAGEVDDPYRLVGPGGLDQLDQPQHDVVGEGVAPVDPVERQPEHAGLDVPVDTAARRGWRE